MKRKNNFRPLIYNRKYEDGGLLDLGLGPINQLNWAAKSSEINPRLNGMMKARLALDSHFGNPTARRMTNYDTRYYTFTGDEINNFGKQASPKGTRGNVYVGSYDNYVTPSIQDIDGQLKFINGNPWKTSPETSQQQSMYFDSPEDAKYFAEHYKEIAPMMNLYSKGGRLNTYRRNFLSILKN